MSLIYQTTGNIDNKQVLKGVNLYDTKEEVKIYDISKNLNKLDSYILAGNIHKHVRKIVQPMIEPGMKLSKIANLIESTTRQLTNNVGINYNPQDIADILNGTIASHDILNKLNMSSPDNFCKAIFQLPVKNFNELGLYSEVF